MTDPAHLIAVTARIARADGTVEQIPLDLEAYRDGRFEPAPVLANGDSLMIVPDYG